MYDLPGFASVLDIGRSGLVGEEFAGDDLVLENEFLYGNLTFSVKELCTDVGLEASVDDVFELSSDDNAELSVDDDFEVSVGAFVIALKDVLE